MIRLGNDQANTILYNSAMAFRYRIVGIFSAGADFVEPTTNAFNTLLDWLTTAGDGYLDQAQTLREQYAADEVLLVNAANAYCGLAWVNLGLSPGYAYANYNGGCLSGRVWGHELGHNFGCYHDRFSDATTAANNPNYLGFGSCWEDKSKTDCTCYSSVMIYQCNTKPNGCKNCVGKNYYANYLVTESGSPTGETDASCGLLMSQNHNTPANYFKSVQPGGMIFSVSPNFAIADSCSVVNISGWQINTAGNDTIRVTLGGYEAKILNQTSNYVIVLSPIVFTPTGVPGDVVVTTQSGRVTTLSNGFKFVSSKYQDFQNFKTPVLPAGIWKNNGTINWSFSSEKGQSVLFKDGGFGSSESFYVRLLWQASQKFDATNGGCSSIAKSITFAYKAYSNYSICYDKISLSVQQNYVAKWTTVWNGQGKKLTGINPWNYVNLTLPAQTTAINIFVNTANIGSCRWWAPGKNLH